MPDQGNSQIHDALGQPADIHDLASQHEKGDRQQREAVSAIDHILRKNLCIKYIQMQHQREA